LDQAFVPFKSSCSLNYCRYRVELFSAIRPIDRGVSDRPS